MTHIQFWVHFQRNDLETNIASSGAPMQRLWIDIGKNQILWGTNGLADPNQEEAYLELPESVIKRRRENQQGQTDIDALNNVFDLILENGKEPSNGQTFSKDLNRINVIMSGGATVHNLNTFIWDFNQ